MPSTRHRLVALTLAAMNVVGCTASRPSVVEPKATEVAAPPRPARKALLKSFSQGPWYAECQTPTAACHRFAPTALTCPAERAAILPGDVCGLAGVTPPKVCEFETGRCRCVHHVYCGGVTPSYLQQQGMSWECAPPRRDGDCPDEAPVAGGACTVTREPCATSGCGTSQSCTCVAGRWACETQHWAPPP